MPKDERQTTTVGKVYFSEAKNMKHQLLHFFEYTDLPEYLQKIVKPFHDMAHHIAEQLPDNAEKTVALRELLEAKDCAIRANDI